MVFDHNWGGGGGVSPNHTLIAVLSEIRKVKKNQKRVTLASGVYSKKLRVGVRTVHSTFRADARQDALP